MVNVGIDIGSTASKVVVMDDKKENIIAKKIMPSGWNSKETSETIHKWLNGDLGYEDDDMHIVATGYGRISVPYADKATTEITCHAKGATYLMPDTDTFTVIDIGGQDTKVIMIENGFVSNFIMNDKCSAGTGKFLEIMANRLGVGLEDMFDLASKGNPIQISSVCTVFAESEIISLMGKGTPKEDIARGVVDSIVTKVVSLARRKDKDGDYFLTGGFSSSDFTIDQLEKALKAKVYTNKDLGRFAGAIGAALLAK